MRAMSLPIPTSSTVHTLRIAAALAALMGGEAAFAAAAATPAPGTGNPAGITAAPSPLFFTQQVSQAAPQQAVVVTNASGIGVGFSDVALRPTGLFAVNVLGSSCFGVVIANGASCTVAVRPLAQAVAGQRAAELNLLTVNFPRVPVASVSLQLTVVPAPPAPPPPPPPPPPPAPNPPAPAPAPALQPQPVSNRLVSAMPGRVGLAATGATTRLVNYQFLGSALQPVGAFVCTQVIVLPASGATNTNPCVPGSQSPALALQTGAYAVQPGATTGGGRASETVVFPEAMGRLSRELAKRSGDGSVYFVREFQNGNYAVVQLQAAGASLADPLTLTDVRMGFTTARGAQVAVSLAPGEPAPAARADIFFTGSGVLRGRWEVVLPGQAAPAAADLLPEAALPPAERGRQPRWQLVDRFEYALPATGRFTLPGPDPARLPTDLPGGYLLLLRIEAGPASGPDAVPDGMATFGMPVLVYQVGTGVDARSALASRFIDLVEPPPDASREGPVIAWRALPEAVTWRVELADAEGKVVGSKLVRAPSTWYELSGALARQTVGRATCWRVLGFDAAWQPVGRSDCRPLS